MTTTEKTLLVIALLVIGGIIVYANRDRIFKKSTPASDAEKSEYEKCIEGHKSMKDGEDCLICSEVEPRQSRGVIKDGECVAQVNEQPASGPKKGSYVVSARDGATVYTLMNNNFVAAVNAPRVPFQTELTIQSLSSDRNYAQTQYGWISLRQIAQVQ